MPKGGIEGGIERIRDAQKPLFDDSDPITRFPLPASHLFFITIDDEIIIE
jgi:hypothetical protein